MNLYKLVRPAWPNLRDSSIILFRALGLHVLVSTLRSIRHLAVGKGYNEPTKIAIRKNRTTALLRALIHIVPISVAMWEIITNWNTYYLGPVIRNQAYYQFGAKVHEMTAQASLAAVVFSYIRYEMSLGQGLPFGALFSGLQISQASYLWSMEFWGSVCSRHLPMKRRVGMVLMVTVAIVLAATVGPSSAILLVPRLDYWPAGATNIWLNVSSQALWPDRTNSSLVPAYCMVSNPQLTENECPSSGWQAIQTLLSISNEILPLSFQSEYYTQGPAAVQVAGAKSLRELRIAHEVVSILPGTDLSTFIATTQQAAVADALSSTGLMWNIARDNITTKTHGSVLDQLDAVHSIANGYYQPYTMASCEHDTIYGYEDQKPVAFPSPPGSSPQMLNTSEWNDSILPSHAFIYTGITRGQLMNTSGSRDEYRLRWIELRENPFYGTAVGAVVLLPRASGNTTQDVLVCNLGAGWGTSRLNISTFSGSPQSVSSEVGGKKLDQDDQSRDAQMAQIAPVSEEADTDNELYFWLPFPQKLVTVTEDWAQYLNPSISSLNTTVFSHLMASRMLVPDIAHSASIILASLLANGLAGTGSTSQLQGTLKTSVQSDGSTGLDGDYWFSGKGDAFIVDPVESEDWVKFRVYSTIEGYAYNTKGATPKFAICFLLAYCVVALGHILYAGITGISSTCWDSIGEVTALAVNSTPSVLLRNTCAGITEINIFKIPVRVLALRDDENSDGEHLELVFGNVDEKTIEHQVIKKNRVYGTLPLITLKKKAL